MGSHRRKWGWWLVAAFAVAVAASLLFHRNPDKPSGQPDASAPGDSMLVAPAGGDFAPVVRDTVYVNVDGETVPVVTERPAEPAGGSSASGSTTAPASAETIVSIPVSDITGVIRQKSGLDITVSTKAPDHIDVSYAGKVDIPLLGEQNVDFTAGFKVVDVQDNRLVLQMDSGTAMNLAADLVAPLILERLPAGLVESFSGGRAVVNLTAVPQFSKRLSGLSITGITVDDSSVRFATVKK